MSSDSSNQTSDTNSIEPEPQHKSWWPLWLLASLILLFLIVIIILRGLCTDIWYINLLRLNDKLCGGTSSLEQQLNLEDGSIKGPEIAEGAIGLDNLSPSLQLSINNLNNLNNQLANLVPGSQGPSGNSGFNGIAGANGATGPAGPVGPAGPTDPCVINGTYFCQNGNSYGTLAVLGTNDAQDLQVKTSGARTATFDVNGNLSMNRLDDLVYGGPADSIFDPGSMSNIVVSTCGLNCPSPVSTYTNSSGNIGWGGGGYINNSFFNLGTLRDVDNITFSIGLFQEVTDSRGLIGRASNTTNSTDLIGAFANVTNSSNLLGYNDFAFGTNTIDNSSGSIIAQGQGAGNSATSVVNSILYTSYDNLAQDIRQSILLTDNDGTFSGVNYSYSNGYLNELTGIDFSNITGAANTLDDVDYAVFFGNAVSIVADPSYDYSFIGADNLGNINTRVNANGYDSWLNLSGGNVGVGTNTPTGAAPAGNLQVVGGVRVGSFDAAAATTVCVDGDGDLSSCSAAASANIYNTDGTIAADRTATLGGFDLTFSGSAQDITIADDGSLLVNTTTPVAGKVAVFNGDVDITGVIDPTALLFSDTTGVSSYNPATSGGYRIGVTGGTQRAIYVSPLSDSANVFEVRNAANTVTTFDVDTLNTRVGINAGAAPGSTLHVVTTETSGTGALFDANSVTTGNGVNITANALTTGFGLNVSTTSTNAGTYAAAFTNSGNNPNNNGIVITAGQDVFAAGSDLITFKRPDGTVIGKVEQNAAGTVAYTLTSDERLKENITDTAYGLDTILAIKVHDYNYISDSSQTQMTGFIAQELYKLFPNAVTVGTDEVDALGRLTDPWAVDYSKLTPLLTKAIQDQDGKIEGINVQLAEYGLKVDNLSEELRLLAGRVDNLEQKFEQYKLETEARIRELEQRTGGSLDSLPVEPGAEPVLAN